jgi:CRISPR-associated protein Csb2
MLCVNVRLRFGVYDAAGADDPQRSEWPPHPARVFCALVASGPDDEEWEALRWLEAQPPPEVHAPALLGEASADLFVVSNAVAPKGGSQEYPGRTQQARVKPRALPAQRTFSVVWPQAEVSPAHLRALQALARRVPYVGRVTADAEVTVSDVIDLVDDDVEVHEPTELRLANVDLRVPYPGYCDRLLDAHLAGRRAWEESRRAPYRRRRPEAPEEPDVVAGPYDNLVVLAVAGRSHLGMPLTATVTEQLRRATMGRVEEVAGAIPPEVSGHDADGIPHVAYLALPNVGEPARLPGSERVFRERNPHADGRLLGVAAAVPTGRADVAAVLHRALVGSPGRAGLAQLTLGRNGVVALEPAGFHGRAAALLPGRWSGPSECWATATPLVLDRFPRAGRDDVEDLVANALATAGYPRPVEVVTQRSPILPGSTTLARSRVQRRAGVPTRPWVHAWVRFPSLVRGPVLAGSMRYRGLGLFAPLTEVTEEQSTSAETAEVVPA